VKIFRFLLIVVPVICIAALALEFLDYPVDFGSYMAGLGVAVIINFLLNTFDEWQSVAERPNERQSIKLETKETPNDIVRAAGAANRKVTIASIVLVIVLIGILISFASF